LAKNEKALLYVSRQDVMVKLDIYSFAIVLHEMITGVKPWHGLDKRETALKVIGDERPPIPVTDDDRVKKLIVIMKMCWRDDPLHRPPASHVIELLKQEKI
jgi:serine/threonine protein kinase